MSVVNDITSLMWNESASNKSIMTFVANTIATIHFNNCQLRNTNRINVPRATLITLVLHRSLLSRKWNVTGIQAAEISRYHERICMRHDHRDRTPRYPASELYLAQDFPFKKFKEGKWNLQGLFKRWFTCVEVVYPWNATRINESNKPEPSIPGSKRPWNMWARNWNVCNDHVALSRCRSLSLISI